MEIRIYRGTRQIGGCVTEITSGSTRIFIDFGSELPGPDGEQKEETLSVPGVTEGEPRCDGIFFTHTHGDHIGQIDRIHPDIPLWLGGTAKELCLTVNRYLQEHKHDRQKTIEALERANTFTMGRPVPVNDFTVTPLFVDHSAFDAYMFLIEGEGKRVLHTGDFRGHGFRGKGLLPTLEKYARDVDWIICEGTMLSRNCETVKTEHELQKDERAQMEKYRRVFVVCSSMNIDRIAGFCKAAPTGRPIICDDYQKRILDVVQKRHRKYTDLYDFSSVIPYDRDNTKLIQWMQDQGFLCFIRPNHFAEVMLKRYGDGAVIAYSQWEGYLRGPTENKRLTELLKGRISEPLHTSGHATAETLREVFNTVKPACGVIPIHSEQPEKFQEILPDANVQLLTDGKTMTL